MHAPSVETSDREIVVARTLFAPRDLVWQALTEPRHLDHWWGPRGAHARTAALALHPGGAWEHTLQHADGIELTQRFIFREILAHERLVYVQGGQRGTDVREGYVASWMLEPASADRTRLTLWMLFPSAARRDEEVREFGAVEEAKQALERLSEYLPAMQVAAFEITRRIAARRETVWKLWTQEAHLRQWFGPRTMQMTRSRLDLRPGGVFHYALRGPDGLEQWGRFIYREIQPPARLVWINAFSDPQGGITAHPFNRAPWPLQLLTVVNFTPAGDHTQVKVRWLPYEAHTTELRGFATNHASMTLGWAGTMERLIAYLARLRFDSATLP